MSHTTNRVNVGRLNNACDAAAQEANVRFPLFTITAVALIWAVFADVGRWSTIGALVVFGATALIAVWSLSPRLSQIAVVVAAALVLPWLVLRATPGLVELDVLAFFVVVTHALSSRRTLVRRSFGGYLAQWLDALAAAFTGPVIVWRALRQYHGRAATHRRLRGSLNVNLAAVVVAVFVGATVVAILASVDPLTASYLSVDDSFAVGLANRLAYAAVGVVVLVGGIGVAARPESRDRPSRPTRPNPALLSGAPQATLFTLIALALTIGAFGGVHLSRALSERAVDSGSGGEGVPWLMYNDLFPFASVAVSLIAVIALVFASAVATEHPAARRRLAIASTLVVAAVGTLVVSSYLSLDTYSDRYGWTMSLFYTTVVAIWLVVVAVLVLVAVWRAGGGWTATAVLVAALVGIVALNVVNPERLVVSHNLDRLIAGELAPSTFTPRDPTLTYIEDGSVTGRFDVDYVANLSPDGLVAAFDRLDDLPSELRLVAASRWCAVDLGSTVGIEYNAAVRAAAAAQLKQCGVPARGTETD